MPGEEDGGAMASSVTQQSSTSAPKDRDPPPSFDGSQPHLFKQFERDVSLWQWESDVPKLKHAAKLLRSLTGSARAAADEVPLEVIQSEGGVKAIMTRLREHYLPHLESAMPRAFEAAIYGDARKSRESNQDYLIRMDKAFKELKDESVTLPEIVKGYIIYRQASLTAVQEDQVTTWTAGDFEREKVIRALRKLEKVQKDKAKSFLTDMVEEADGGAAYFEDDADLENYVYVEEGDLNQVFEEADLHEALATYQEVRRALRDQRNSRGWQPPSKGSGKGTFGKGGLHFGKGSRVHTESLKLRTKCAKCGVIGHWARECTGSPDEFARQRGGGSSPAKSSASSMAGKSGFVQIGKGEDGTVLMSMLEHPVTFGQFYRSSPKKVSNLEFIGLATHAEQGIVDTAAQSGLIGEKAFNSLEKSLEERGLKPRKTNRQAQARGVGGEAVSIGVAELPLGIAGVNGVLEVTIVKDEVPLLIPVSLLRDLGACVDLVNNELKLGKYDKKASMSVLKSGHVSVSVLDFDSEGWRIPKEALDHGLHEQDFRIEPGAIAMSTFKSGSPNQFDTTCGSSHHVDVRATQQDFQGYGASKCFIQCQHGESEGGKACKSHAEVERHGGEAGADHQVLRRDHSTSRRCSGRSSALARRWLALWLCSSVWTGGDCAPLACVSRAYEQARSVRRTDQDWYPIASKEDDQASNSRRSWMPASYDQSCWSGEPVSTRSVVSGLPCPMESGNYITRTNDTIIQDKCIYKEGSGCITSQRRRSSITSAKCEVDGYGVPVQLSGTTDPGPEGWTDKGASLLQVREKAVRLLCLGPSGAGGTPEGVTSGSRGKPGSGEDERGDVRGNEASEEARREAEGEREGSKGGASREGRGTELQLNRSAQSMVESVMAHADQKHGELMQGQKFQHQMEMETMQNQLLWMMAVVGEDKISQVLNDPQQHAESMRKALEIKQGMIQTQGPLPEQEG